MIGKWGEIKGKFDLVRVSRGGSSYKGFTLFTLLLISIRLNPLESVTECTNQIQKFIKELVILSNLCNFRALQAITKGIAATENCQVAGWLVQCTILCKV